MQPPDTVSRPVRRRVEVGGSVHSVVELFDDHVVVRLGGEFSRSTAPTVGRTLVRLLRGGEDVRPDEVRRHFALTDGCTAGPSARSAVLAACHDWRVSHVAPTAALIASELVINAVAHARSAPELTIRLQRSTVTVGVRDDLRCPLRGRSCAASTDPADGAC